MVVQQSWTIGIHTQDCCTIPALYQCANTRRK